MKKHAFHIGLPLSLQIPRYEERYSLPLIGWDRNSFLIAKFTSLSDLPVSLSSNDPCVIRFLSEGEVYGFHTEVLSVQFYPTAMVFFKYPSDIKRMELRRHKRFRLNVPARIMHTGHMARKDADIIDISESGCQVRTLLAGDEQFNPDDVIYVTCNIMGKPLELDCILRNIRVVDDLKHFGAEFINISEEKTSTIKSVINILNEAA